MNYFEIIKPIVLPNLKHYQNDLLVHDYNRLKEYSGRFLYGYRDSGTDLFLIDHLFINLKDVLENGKSACFSENYLNLLYSGEATFEHFDAGLESILRDSRFLCGAHGKITEITLNQVVLIQARLSRLFNNYRNKIRDKYNHLYKQYNIIDKTEGHLDNIKEFAKKNNLTKELQHVFDHLERFRHAGNNVLLYTDFAPYSMSFCLKSHQDKVSLNGGIIFHGLHDNGGDGSYPTLSVCLNPDTNPHWSIHT